MAQHVIYIPGLADRLNRRIGQATALLLWRLNGIHTHYFVVGWADKDEVFDRKLERLLHKIDHLQAKGYAVSLVASSAGASLALLALRQRPDLQAVVTICAFLRDPQVAPEILYATNPALKVSIQRFRTIEPHINPAMRAKVLSVEPLEDHLVPVGDMHITGTTIEQIPVHGHLRGIFAALTFFRRRLIRFIRRGS
jgi:hypothetical protein